MFFHVQSGIRSKSHPQKHTRLRARAHAHTHTHTRTHIHHHLLCFFARKLECCYGFSRKTARHTHYLSCELEKRFNRAIAFSAFFLDNYFQAREADSPQEQCQTSALIHRHKNGDAGQQPASFFLCDARNRELSQETAEKN